MTEKSRRIPARLQDIREAINNAREDLGSMSKDQFLVDGKTQRAVIESIIVIGEASSHVMRLDPAIETTAPELWKQLREAYQMRNLVTHEYHRVDATVVWDTVKLDLPAMDGLISGFLANASENR